MRIDKYLKLTRIIKRRTIAKDISDNGLVFINNRQVKPSALVSVNDIIKLVLGKVIIEVKVLLIDEKEIIKNAEAYLILSKTYNED